MKKPELVEYPIRVSLDTMNRFNEIGAHGGLTGEVMFQAVTILALCRDGWIKLETPDPKPDLAPINTKKPRK